MSSFFRFTNRSQQLAALQRSCNQKDEEIKTLQVLLRKAGDKLKETEKELDSLKAQHTQVAEEVATTDEDVHNKMIQLDDDNLLQPDHDHFLSVESIRNLSDNEQQQEQIKEIIEESNDVEVLLKEQQELLTKISTEQDSKLTNSLNSAERGTDMVQAYQNIELQLLEKDKQLELNDVEISDLAKHLETQLHGMHSQLQDGQVCDTTATVESRKSEVLPRESSIHLTTPESTTIEQKQINLLQKEQVFSGDLVEASVIIDNKDDIGSTTATVAQPLSGSARLHKLSVNELTKELMKATETAVTHYIGKLAQELEVQDKKNAEAVQNQVEALQLRIKSHSEELENEKRATKSVMNELGCSKNIIQQLQTDKADIEQHMTSQVVTLEVKVKELTNELAIEHKATEAAMSQLDDTVGKLQQVQNEKRILDQQMTTGNKEREDRIAELEEFINDQVTELDKMEAALKQTVANKEVLESAHKELFETSSLIKRHRNQALQQVKELTEELSFEKDITKQARCEMDYLKCHIEQLLTDKASLEQHMLTGNKEREDRIAELEEFINDQVTELDKMEAALKQTVAIKEKVEEDYKQVDEHYKSAKVKVENYHKRFIDQEQSINQQKQFLEQKGNEISTLMREKETLLQKINHLLQEVARLIDVDTQNNHLRDLLQNAEQKIEQLAIELCRVEEELRNKESMLKKIELEKARELELTDVVDLDIEIGSGSVGFVKEVLLYGTRCAAKDVHKLLVENVGKKQFEHVKKKFLKECDIYSKLSHPNIVQFLGIFNPSQDAKLPWLVMEKLATNLTSFLKRYNFHQVSHFVKISMLLDVSLGIQYLHAKNIIHRDLSSNNILLTKYLTAKIADLGVAKMIDPTLNKTHTLAPGTQAFMPPEALSVKPHYGKPVDVFSLGCVMIHVMTHEFPIPLDQVQTDPLTGKVTAFTETERRTKYLKAIPKSFSLKGMVYKCLDNIPESRIVIAEVVKQVAELQATCEESQTKDVLELHARLSMRVQEMEAALNEKEQIVSKLKCAGPNNTTPS